ncbi:Leucine-rich receptor-like protein kinase family protein [Forsythia ovata]|uniref:Leucine-rich receptor-like protein kinase family protein n=1 Tax=Forsythia ovata TaxID=205694 RepID=A0ABD1QBN2_9LAMI
MDEWNASTLSAPYDWRGIVCFQGKVRELRLPCLQLSGRLMDELAKLRQLRKLSLHSNSLNGLTNIQVLNLTHNNLSGVISSQVSVSLWVLDLSCNSFSGEILTNFKVTYQLQLINLSFNDFSSAIPTTIGALQQLQYLWHDSNKLYGTTLSAIANCSALVHFNASDNKLSGVFPATLGSLKSLQVISLPHNQLSEMKNLTALFLGGNSFTSPVLVSLGYLYQLELLDLSDNKLTENLTTEFMRLTNLTNNRFSGEVLLNVGSGVGGVR